MLYKKPFVNLTPLLDLLFIVIFAYQMNVNLEVDKHIQTEVDKRMDQQEVEQRKEESSLKQAREELLGIAEMINREKGNLANLQNELARLKAEQKRLEAQRPQPKDLPDDTDRDKDAGKGISGIWEFQLHIYQLMGPRGNTIKVDRQTQYTVNLSRQGRAITGELVGAVRRKDDPRFDQGLSCGQADIKGEIQDSGNIMLVLTFTGNCCPGSQEVIRGKYDPAGNIVGELKWARTGSCVGAWAEVVGTKR